MRQRSDDSGRNLRGVWLGPEGAFRWPFDATFTEWAVSIPAAAAALIMLWLVTPLAVLAAAGLHHISGWLATNASIGLGGHRARYLTWWASGALTLLAVAPDLSTWLMPLPWWLAAPGSIVVAFLAVRAARPYLDGNRPPSYWLATFRRVAAGPRPLRPAAEITTEGFIALDGHDTDLGDDLWAFMSAVNGANPEGAIMGRYRRRTPEVEAVLWDIASGSESTGADVIAWLRGKGLPVTVHSVEYRMAFDGTRYPASADVELDGITLPQKCVIFVHSDAPKVWGTRPIETFANEFEEVHLATPEP